jgi:DNA-binding SARP family transcriptional activator/TolB-like protein
MAFQLCVLGRFKLTSPKGVVVPITSRKAQILLAVLAYEAGEAVPRSRLAALLWSDDSESKARNSLRQAFTALRKAMARHGDFPIEIDGESASIRPAAIGSDIEMLLDPDCSPATAAANLSGEFLEGLHCSESVLEDWLRAMRAHLRAIRIERLSVGASAMERRGDLDGACRLARLVLELDPYEEAAGRVLMRCLAAKGEAAHAIQVYTALRERLLADLDVAPDHETRRLSESIRRETAGLGVPAAPELPPSDPPAGGKPTIAVASASTTLDRAGDRAFADALTHSMLSGLTNVAGISVIAAATVIPHHQLLTAQEIGLRSGAQYVLETVVLSLSGRMRIAVKCAHVATGQQVFANVYGCDGPDLFQAVDDLMLHFCAELELAVTTHGIGMAGSPAARPDQMPL